MSDTTITQFSPLTNVQSYMKPFESEEEKTNVSNVTKVESGDDRKNNVSSAKKEEEVVSLQKASEENAAEEKIAEEEHEPSAAVQEMMLERQVEIANDLNRQNIGLAFSVDKTYGSESTIVNVIDQNTDKTVRQIPSEEFLKLSQRLQEMKESQFVSPTEKETVLKGMLLDDQAQRTVYISLRIEPLPESGFFYQNCLM